ncbi:hypothetical protein DOTSEDRAFT_74465 [Dothistroma septosporum NZE10]|uniref:Uncharacterized protein n=1 Tax=Dothistroma septosporum (strain NZE10 / CBS 128990) TaxID=675120 RepID=N1PE71_DOTSN|nr:hypothetical protein DOTSEDRAFT_74465 [Dothistroma septosporum NZE10]
MALLKRLSDGFWHHVSPQKQKPAAALPTPKTEPTFTKPNLPPRRTSMHELKRVVRSMSPSERVGGWQVQSPGLSSRASMSTPASSKRKRPYTPESSAGRRRNLKMRRIDVQCTGIDGDVENMEDDDEDTAVHEGELYELARNWRSRSSTPRSRDEKSTSLEAEDFEDDESIEKTVVVSEDRYTPLPRRVIDLPKEHGMRHISTEELRAQGWDDDYITLIQKIGMRGYEPLLPRYIKFEYMFLPDGLFEQTDDAFIGSVRGFRPGAHFKAGKALTRLFELGGRVRDRAELIADGESTVGPEEQSRKQLNAYVKWAFEDAQIDKATAIPILATVFRPAGTEASELRTEATRRCRRLAARYREALRVQRSVEVSPGSRSSMGTILSYELPTFYALVASHTIVALMAYRPEDENPEVKPMAYFDLGEHDHDVWNALAIAILVCHVRDVHIRIATDTQLGLREDSSKSSFDDEDV